MAEHIPFPEGFKLSVTLRSYARTAEAEGYSFVAANFLRAAAIVEKSEQQEH
ncbi:hypothetical protein [Antarcticirhabdus aurantiaca]|uniref:Uncharacterized protein n=1 Tax=Antarcticirhabdus aurantiaca TaxID=2606717 RepID=A0ACD4NLA9_9HYPH|nr:hypothetical protein [Antarcticirhabdus aurantiaca]WAJ27544.1 hypothetical protein OXU80_22285 [Jeongeuplla avenae]